MKVLIYSRGVPTASNPQEGCFEWDQALALKSIGHEPIVMYLDARWRKNRHRWGITKTIKDGIEVYSIYGGTTTLIERLFGTFSTLWYNEWLCKLLFKRILKEHKDIDIIHSHYTTGIHRISTITRNTNIPTVGTEHLSKIAENPISHGLKKLAFEAYHHTDTLISVSPYLQEKIKTIFNIDSVVCPNVLGDLFLKPLSKRDLIDATKPFTFVACGSLIPRKDFMTLLQAFKLIEKENVQLLIIGEGPERKKLETFINTNNLGDKIKLLGSKLKTEIISILDTADCFVLSSISETFGVVAIEALSRGLPVISTHCGGTEQIIDIDNGVFVNPGDIKEMSDALLYMKQSAKKYDNQTIREGCLKKYSPVAIADQLNNIYLQTIKKCTQRE